jgi:hypothetical protein
MAIRHTRLLILTGMLAAAAAVEARGQMPFADTYRRPSVSPYTMLGAGNIAGGGGAGGGVGVNPLVFQQLVQPRVEQEQQFIRQMQQGRQINRLQGRVTEIQQGTTARQINEMIRPTGHAATYQNLSHFYPGR